MSGKKGDAYLRRIGRDRVTPDDLTNYHQEKHRRNEQRRQIINDIESRELTFKPRINARSQKLEAKLKASNSLRIDPSSKMRQYTGRKASEADTNIIEGPTLMLESDHPYLNNANEFSTVNIPNAVSYTIIFDERSSTEPIHDFIKFYRDDAHVEYYGVNKYFGGLASSPCNWPGVNGRPPLVIDASKFIVHFKSNGTTNDWGFLIKIIPNVKVFDNDNESVKSGNPQISYLGKTYKNSKQQDGDIYNRLYDHGMTGIVAQRDLLVSFRIY